MNLNNDNIKDEYRELYTSLCREIIHQASQQLAEDKSPNASLLKASFDIMNIMHNLKFQEVIEDDPDLQIEFIEDDSALD